MNKVTDTNRPFRRLQLCSWAKMFVCSQFVETNSTGIWICSKDPGDRILFLSCYTYWVHSEILATLQCGWQLGVISSSLSQLEWKVVLSLYVKSVCFIIILKRKKSRAYICYNKEGKWPWFLNTKQRSYLLNKINCKVKLNQSLTLCLNFLVFWAAVTPMV